MKYYSMANRGFYMDDIHGLNIPSDVIAISDDVYERLLDGQMMGQIIVADQRGFPVLQDPTPPAINEIKQRYTAAIQARLDDFARTRGYDGILSACSYATSTNAKFSAEGQYCVEARDITWATCYAIIADVESGKRTMPTLGEIMAELPALAWPVTTT